MWYIIKYRLYNSSQRGNIRKIGIGENVGLWFCAKNKSRKNFLRLYIIS